MLLSPFLAKIHVKSLARILRVATRPHCEVADCKNCTCKVTLVSKVSADMLPQQILWESENRKAEVEKPSGIIVLVIVLNKRGPLLATHLKSIPIPSILSFYH